MAFGTGVGKRRRDKVHDILSNVREGFAKRRARLGKGGNTARLDAGAVRALSSSLGVQKENAVN